MRKNSVPSFIQKTWEILQQQLHTQILAWTPLGCSFIILNRQRLSSQVLPLYFKHSNFSSFVRQLNMYNFHKVRNQDNLQFCHKLFRKDQRELLIGIKRKPSEDQIVYGDQLIAKISINKENSIFKKNEINSSDIAFHYPPPKFTNNESIKDQFQSKIFKQQCLITMRKNLSSNITQIKPNISSFQIVNSKRNVNDQQILAKGFRVIENVINVIFQIIIKAPTEN